MDIMQIWSAYQKDADPETIFPMYQQCDIAAKTPGYGDLSLLHIACQNAHPEAVAWLLEQGLDPNEASSYGDLPLFLLAHKSFSCQYSPREGDIYRSALALLDAKASVPRRNESGKFCFHVAAEEGNVEFLRALAERDVKLTKADRDGNTGLHLLVEACRNPLEALERVNKDIENKRNEESLPPKLRSPISLDELEARKRAVEETLENLFRCAVILLDAGVNPETENQMQETAHTLAVRAGAKKIAALLDGSYSPDADDSPDMQQKIAAGGMTLHEAVRRGDEEAVRALAGMGADINGLGDEASFEGLSPLAVACQTCNVRMAALLLELGANPSQKNGKGEPPVVELFSRHWGLHPSTNLYRDKLPVQLLDLLIQHGFDPDSSLNDNGDCLLGLACASQQGGASGDESLTDMVVKEAIRRGADVNRKNDFGQTPLMLACTGYFPSMEKVLTMLLEAGADVTLRDVQGSTALHYAANREVNSDATAMSELMLDFGEPDVNVVNAEGKTALDYAVERNNTPLVNLLLPYMA